MASTSHEEQVLYQSKHRRRGWVIASEDGTEIERPTSFDPRRSAAAWNKGQGPSQASIPSRASSLAPPSSPTAAAPSLPQNVPTNDQPTSGQSVEKRPPPLTRRSSSTSDHDRDASNGSTELDAQAESSSSGRRRPSPPLLVPPKQTYRKIPSGRVLPPSAFTDHQKLLAGAARPQRMGAVDRSSPSTSYSPSPTPSAVSSQPRPPVLKANLGLRSDLALLAARRRAANSSGSSSAATGSYTPDQTASYSSPASSVASTSAAYQYSAKGKQPATSPLRNDEEDFFSSGTEQNPAIVVRPPSQAWSGTQLNSSGQPSLLFSPGPLPPLSEKSAASDVDDVLSSTSENLTDSEGTAGSGARPGRRRDSLRIELPPPPAQFKDRYPSIMVDSTHASDSEASGTSTGVQRRRRRRSTASTQLLGVDAEDDDEEFADDDSSWPSTPSTTPLENYFAAANPRSKPSRKAFQTTKEIIAPDSGLGMGRPMVVVTSPSTASEVSSDRRSSSGSGSNSERAMSSSPPAAAIVPPVPMLSKIEEHPVQNVAPDAGPSTAPAPRRSLSFELPVARMTRSSADLVSGAAAVRSPSRAMAFLAKISPNRISNRSSTDLTSPVRSEDTADPATGPTSEGQRRASMEPRRSVELRPILLNAASRPKPRPLSSDEGPRRPTPTTSAASAQAVQQRRQSSGRIPIRPNVVPYHSRRSSELSDASSNNSPLLHNRGSFDKDLADPAYSPLSQNTTLTMPSPALSTDQKPFSYHSSGAERSSSESIEPRVASARASQDQAAASATYLPHVNKAERRAAFQGETEARPSAIRLLVDSQKGRMSRDNDSIAEWISVSVNDLPLSDQGHSYGNGGAGEFSNEQQKAGKKVLKNKPWKLGRFAASEVVLPTKVASSSAAAPSAKTSVEAKRRSVSLLKRASSAQVNETARKDTGAAPVAGKGPLPLMRNLGFTTANRNVVLQNLCAERSISALAASTVYIAGCGRIDVPAPQAVPATKQKPKTKPVPTPAKRAILSSVEPAPLPATKAQDPPKAPVRRAEPAQEAYLNVKEGRHVGYSLSGAGAGTVKSMVPELGDWSGSSGHHSGPDEDEEPIKPFRDYEDEGSDLFDSDAESSQSEDGETYDEEYDAEVPVRFGQRFSATSKATPEVVSPIRPATARNELTQQQRADMPIVNAGVDKVAVSPSLERLAPGKVVLRGAEMRLCVKDDDATSAAAGVQHYWKALQVQKATGGTGNEGQQQVRKQPSSRAMKLEQEVAMGIFAGFVGNRSPKRQAQRSFSSDSGTSDASAQVSGGKELLISKMDHSTFSVRALPGAIGSRHEQVLEVVCRSTAAKTKVELAFPSPLLSFAEFAHGRSRSGRSEGSQASLGDKEGTKQRLTIHVQRQGGRGFAASFRAQEGQHWTWHASKLEASVLSRPQDSRTKPLLAVLDNYDLSLRTMQEHETVELATYSTESQVRNALGIFRPRTKSGPKPMPEDVSQVGPAVPPPAQVLPLAVAHRGFASPVGRAEVPIPRRGIRGGPLLRPQPHAAGSAARHHGLWQNQRAAISTEAVVQVHNNAVNNARASLQLEERPRLVHAPTDNAERLQAWRTAATGQQDAITAGDKMMGELTFSSHAAAVHRDLVVLTLFAVLGMAEP
ncbi:hypothetical protein PANT_22d00193 [Moesziomyces antarcticus T-34]|uniref:Uncharacterized protein n=1 Tax=Pseudozyma antarctica (strain T-34) TaxID=1151754 RepID=M9LSF9_PSEA3|nr:hypothetical protein PANT_22d00193 [Moesziomyces antarcticus T-34]